MTKKSLNPLENQQGMVLVAIVSIMIFIGVIMLGVFSLATSNLSRSRGRILSLEAQYAAESGADAAIATLNNGNDAYTGTNSEVNVLTAGTYKATYTVAVSNGSTSKERVMTAVGRVYTPNTAATPTYKRTIRVTVQRSSTTAASSVLSRNIIALDSGIKNLYAKDIYANGYITMAKNTTNLVAENIYVAGKNTGATNCSIGGTGNLVKPASFSTPGQTKTNITLTYNNCISPPGNNSNANFNVLANQNSVPTVQSTYIPWSQFMDSSYQNSPTGCSDWTSGASPRNIPSTGNAKKTHYPDSGSNISSSCGTSGDLSLGSTQFNIKDNVHVRANLCAASACSPTFYNPDATIKYIFVEGDVNFSSVQTASGSGPIVFIVYGTDPASKAGSCPYGGSGYLGNGSTTNAPALYLLTMNGICLDKIKFGASPALGGIGGKNIYIATNPGTPFDLKLDPDFPVSQIPVDLSWRAVRYQRL
jgi:Tfp pilus assembly protein PilX